MCTNHFAMEENGELLITALTLQVTTQEGIAPQDTEVFLKDSIAYWNQPKAGAELQVALEKMSWPEVCHEDEDSDIFQTPSKLHKAT